jgi:alpha-beta hydrolase superfamily lysophospholipase
MWPYTPDEQTWLVPSKEWTASVMAAERAKHIAAEWREVQLPLPLPAPYDDFVTDPQIMLRK